MRWIHGQPQSGWWHWDKVMLAPSGCWIWTGATNGKYGVVQHQGRLTMAHRVAYEAYVGRLDPILEIDHLCRVTRCVNPQHLEQVTRVENLRRARPYRRPRSERRHRPEPGRTRPKRVPKDAYDYSPEYGETWV